MPYVYGDKFFEEHVTEIVTHMSDFEDRKVSIPKVMYRFHVGRDVATRMRSAVQARLQDPEAYREAKEKADRFEEEQRLRREKLRLEREGQRPPIYVPSQEEREEVNRRIEEEKANPKAEYVG